MIYTDGQGRPIPEPERSDFPDDISFLRAYAAWRDKLTGLANAAFAAQFRKSLTRP